MSCQCFLLCFSHSLSLSDLSRFDGKSLKLKTSNLDITESYLERPGLRKPWRHAGKARLGILCLLMFTASHCLSCSMLSGINCFFKDCWCLVYRSTCACVCVHLFLCLFTIFGAFHQITFRVLTNIPIPVFDVNYQNPIDFPFKLSGRIRRVNDRSTSWQSLWEAELAIKSQDRLKRERLPRVWWEPENCSSIRRSIFTIFV